MLTVSKHTVSKISFGAFEQPKHQILNKSCAYQAQMKVTLNSALGQDKLLCSLKIRSISYWHIHTDNVVLPPVSFQFMILGIASMCVNSHSEYNELGFLLKKFDFMTEDNLQQSCGLKGKPVHTIWLWEYCEALPVVGSENRVEVSTSLWNQLGEESWPLVLQCGLQVTVQSLFISGSKRYRRFSWIALQYVQQPWFRKRSCPPFYSHFSREVCPDHQSIATGMKTLLSIRKNFFTLSTSIYINKM